MRLSTLILSSPLLALAQPGTVPKCTFDDPASMALTSIILDCHDKLGSDPSGTLTVSSDSVVACYLMSRDRSSISEVVVRRREGRNDAVYRTTKGQVACAVQEILGSCQFGDGGKLVGGKYVVCNSDDLYVDVQGKGNN